MAHATSLLAVLLKDKGTGLSKAEGAVYGGVLAWPRRPGMVSLMYIYSCPNSLSHNPKRWHITISMLQLRPSEAGEPAQRWKKTRASAAMWIGGKGSPCLVPSFRTKLDQGIRHVFLKSSDWSVAWQQAIVKTWLAEQGGKGHSWVIPEFKLPMGGQARAGTANSGKHIEQKPWRPWADMAGSGPQCPCRYHEKSWRDSIQPLLLLQFQKTSSASKLADPGTT
jgi:hypothetical protein